MDKNKFCEELKKKGYDAFIESGVVMVRKPGKIEDTIKEIKDLAAKCEYNESIGVRAVVALKSPTPEKKEEPDAEEFFDEDEAEELPEDIDAPKEEGTSSFEQMNLFDMI